MIFEALWGSAQRGELMLVDGGMCNWHLRQDGQLTIREIIVLPERHRQGIGRSMLAQLKQVPGTMSIFAKCPADLLANEWYRHQGFHMEQCEVTKSGRKICHWRLYIAPAATADSQK